MTDDFDTEEWVEDYITELLDRADLDVSIEELSFDDEHVLRAELAGPDSARLIGRDGQTLEALQHLVVSSAIHQGLARQRILVDVERYRSRREQRVQEEASRLAKEALETGESQDLSPMSPRERRLVHMVVADVDGVTTESSGEGDERFVRVVPVGA